MGFYDSFKKDHLIAAHRGGGKYKENTIAAFLYAKSRCDFIEFDVRECKDEIVVFHDKDLKRLFNKNELVKDLRYGELKKYFIPSLKEVLDVLEDFPINIEIKTQKHDKEKFVKRLLGILNGRKNVLISAFNFDYLRLVDYPKAILLENRIELPEDFEYEAVHINKEYLKHLKTDKFVGVYTVNEKDEIERLFKSGVKAVFTDNLEL